MGGGEDGEKASRPPQITSAISKNVTSKVRRMLKWVKTNLNNTNKKIKETT